VKTPLSNSPRAFSRQARGPEGVTKFEWRAAASGFGIAASLPSLRLWRRLLTCRSSQKFQDFGDGFLGFHGGQDAAAEF
jgi:hypothetical protein